MRPTQDRGTSFGTEPEQPDNYTNDTAFKSIPKAKQWRIMAERGDVRALLRELERAQTDRVHTVELGECLNDAMSLLAQSDPDALARHLHGEALFTIGKLILRGQLALNHYLSHGSESLDQDPRRARELFAAVADPIMAIHASVAKLQQMDANTQRLHEQTRKLRLANDRAEAKMNRSRRPRRHQRSSSTHADASSPSSRIGGDFPC